MTTVQIKDGKVADSMTRLSGQRRAEFRRKARCLCWSPNTPDEESEFDKRLRQEMEANPTLAAQNSTRALQDLTLGDVDKIKREIQQSKKHVKRGGNRQGRRGVAHSSKTSKRKIRQVDSSDEDSAIMIDEPHKGSGRRISPRTSPDAGISAEDQAVIDRLVAETDTNFKLDFESQQQAECSQFGMQPTQPVRYGESDPDLVENPTILARNNDFKPAPRANLAATPAQPDHPQSLGAKAMLIPPVAPQVEETAAGEPPALPPLPPNSLDFGEFEF